MLDRLHSAYRVAAHSLELIADGVASVDLRWLAAGVLIHLISQAVRTRGWYTIIRAAYPDARELRARHVIGAYFAGAGLNGVLPARGGDLVKLLLVHRRIPDSRYSTLAATFVPETLFETAFGAALVAWALSQGFLPVPVSPQDLPSVDVSLMIEHPVISAFAAGGLALGAALLVGWMRRRATALLERLARGLAILHRPRDFVRGVVSWQALGRLIRGVSLACLMAAFALPVTLTTVVLVMAAQGGGRIIPLAPASAGLRLAMLAYGFVEVTGEAVDIARITAFTFGVGAALLATGLALSAAILTAELGSPSPGRALAAARAALEARRVAPRTEQPE